MAWISIICWGVFSGLVAKLSAKQAYALASSARTQTEKWMLLRALMKKVGLLGVLLCLVCCSFIALFLDASPGFSLMIGGFSFILLTAIQQVGFAIGLYIPFVAIRGDEWPRSTFIFRMTINVWSLCLPLGLTIMLIGAGINLSTKSASMDTLIILLGTVFLWIIQWSVLRALTLPGRLVEFPKREWESQAIALSKTLGTKLNDLMMLQTGKARVAGAFALGGGKVAMTDYLLSALNEQEFMAVMAHELQHFNQRRETFILIGKLTLLCALIGAIVAFLAWQKFLPVPFAGAAAVFISIASIRPIQKLKQGHEDDADDAAIREIGAMPLMIAIAKTYALNGRLHDRGRGTVHRALRERLARIASIGELSADTVEVALVEARSLVPENRQVSFQTV